VDYGVDALKCLQNTAVCARLVVDKCPLLGRRDADMLALPP
jgi:hypothetical protein